MKITAPKFIITLLASVCLISQAIGQKEKERIEKYIEQYKELAVNEMVRTGVPACITLAQGLLETGYGQSDLALNANNHFGIKCKAEWNGETILHDDDKKSECFRKYSCVQDSYKDHSDFLRSRPNYASLFLLNPTDYSAWAYGLKKAGYATSPTYSERLIKLIEDNALQQYTELALAQQNQHTELPIAVPDILNTKENRIREAIIAIASDTRVGAGSGLNNEAVQSSEVKDVKDYPTGIFKINGLKVMFAEQGTSLFAIANNNSISYSKLLEFNELDKTDILEKSQLIFLEKKQKKGENDVHIVANNETLYDICQMEGVQLSSILEFNHIQKDMMPVTGIKLFLKSRTSGVSNVNVGNNKEYTSSMR